MLYSSNAVEVAIAALSKLPGIGRRTAQRLVFFLLKSPRAEVEALAAALVALKEKVRNCSRCYNITEQDPCPICTNPQRDGRIICVVEEANDVLAIEKTGEFRGFYHVLGGALSPLDGIGPDDLKVRELLSRLHSGVEEVILATNPTAEGEATAIYLANLIRPLGLRLSRIARGIPVGGDLEYADEVTLTRAMEGRVQW
ncbi:MAG: recombination mediator RecR [candidate division KSB1 bacterium]|nr:recombination mediator RecR [candidate division KSB1 bacterium]MDZ7302817.1 recombination mediator RecR [candidate division KSB1 bacterium]MDZ7311834.1 recombination mediator RecR [candidate division KSB1 bacterium]